MKAYELQGPGGVDALMPVDKPMPSPGPGEVLVKLKAATINYRDLLTVKGGYGSRQKFPLVPLSDGAGVVASVGAGVAGFKTGDRVTGSFFEGWLGGEPSEEKMRSNLGGALDGVWRNRHTRTGSETRKTSPSPSSSVSMWRGVSSTPKWRRQFSTVSGSALIRAFCRQ